MTFEVKCSCYFSLLLISPNNYLQKDIQKYLKYRVHFINTDGSFDVINRYDFQVAFLVMFEYCFWRGICWVSPPSAPSLPFAWVLVRSEFHEMMVSLWNLLLKNGWKCSFKNQRCWQGSLLFCICKGEALEFKRKVFIFSSS